MTITKGINTQQMELPIREIYDDSDEDVEEDEIENLEPFDPTKIRIKTKMMSIDILLKRIQHDEIDLAPDFQRHADIWNDKNKSRLIESVLIGIPLPAFYVDATTDDKWLVIDGIQRINTFKKFILDQELRLTDLQFLRDLEHKKYDELSRHHQRRIEETELIVCLVESGTPPEVKYNIFQRINTGGVSLNNQELRQAMYPGKSLRILKEFSELAEFKKLINISEKRRKRMDDHEYIIGFIAFWLIDYHDYTQGRNEFLNSAMSKLNNLEDTRLKDMKRDFIKSMRAADSIFSSNAFRKPPKNGKTRFPVNKSLFEAWSVILSRLTPGQIDKLINYKDLLNKTFMKKIETDANFEKSISQASDQVIYRFEQINQIVREILSC
ncbi:MULTISPECIES: DUF262 domain-containing protein [Cylindrospermopsis]|jgi:hypothetical protein|uniref:DUF262 domain-containing protein n=2 Tax=Cylindrospermopsis TaxID=77021 RepID=A0A7H0F4G0_9CYAN|nr:MULTISPECIES: DUF262 domain-containing protein [Cylindrospermopsis]MBU6346657.1 DUF262 domain-containing protein [Cyanobacteria bacterium REEB494]KRH95858.1 hypothetical protein ASL19_03065 [Cylindrospermopsis sp. CR12]QNP30926.1 DUF262 domain-containing protein [Cylindrospermopsis curvispora GIHE-G1]UJL32334.1 DUF262 domain-containing protein [Cylindrospermopsis raciborskii Cr2010]UJS04772.1 DUF262 domain-containing protein [Cylindrospermopsis raciborskii KLL07]